MSSDLNRPHQTFVFNSTTDYDRSMFPLMKVKAKKPLNQVDLVLEVTLDEMFKIHQMVGNEENFQRLIPVIQHVKAQYDSLMVDREKLEQQRKSLNLMKQFSTYLSRRSLLNAGKALYAETRSISERMRNNLLSVNRDHMQPMEDNDLASDAHNVAIAVELPLVSETDLHEATSTLLTEVVPVESFIYSKVELLEGNPFLEENVMSPASESESDGITNFPRSSSASSLTPVSPELSGIRIRQGYTSDADDDRPLDEHVRLLNESYASSTVVDNDDLCALGHESSLVSIATSLLPRYTEQISVDNSLSFINAIVDSFSPYRELREACSDSEFDRILEKLNSEWYFLGASLVALSGLDSAVFGFSSGSLFSVDSFARNSIVIGSVASAIGLAIDGWYFLVYSGADAKKFQRLARDIYGTYLFFCISSRLPAVCMFVSICALMAFSIAVAWSAWPKAVLVMCLMASVLICLQFIIYGLHWVVICVTETVRAVRRGLT